jgi:DNA invertase Pin-like site-specific DNA recombinase
MPTCAIYARFSTDRQNPSSAEDQIRVCTERAQREGWTIGGAYADLAISGADNRRPQLTRLLADIASGTYEIVLAEALDRMARDQEDIARIYKRIRFAGARLITLTDGEVSEIHIGLKGTMDALELQKMADKIRRGARGALRRGRIPAGVSYGYAPDPQFREDGTVDRGRRRIVPEEAEVIRRIFREYVAGASPRAIAKGLNAERVKAPRGGEWRASTITGSRGRQNGILHNPAYDGRFLYGRVKMLRHPETRNRVSRLTTPGDRDEVEMPELRIIDRDSWLRAQAIVEERGADAPQWRPRAKRLLSGLVHCGECGGRFAVISTDRWGCMRHREAGTCPNGRRIGTIELETRVLAGLKEKLLSPDAVAHMVQQYHHERTRLAKETARSRANAERRLAAAEAAITRLVDALADGEMSMPEIRGKLRERREERDRLVGELGEMEALPVIALHPQIAESYRKWVSQLELRVGDAGDSVIAAQIRGIIQVVTITPRLDGGNDIDVLTSLQAAIDAAAGRPASKVTRTGDRMIQMVAEDSYRLSHPGRLIRA